MGGPGSARFLNSDADFPEWRNRETLCHAHQDPLLHHLGELIPTLLKRPSGGQHAPQAGNLSVEGPILQFVIARAPKCLLHVLSNHDRLSLALG